MSAITFPIDYGANSVQLAAQEMQAYVSQYTADYNTLTALSSASTVAISSGNFSYTTTDATLVAAVNAAAAARLVVVEAIYTSTVNAYNAYSAAIVSAGLPIIPTA